jgi:hypothetical protein
MFKQAIGLQRQPQDMKCIQKRYSVLLGGVTQMDEFTWSNDAQRGEAGQFAV